MAGLGDDDVDVAVALRPARADGVELRVEHVGVGNAVMPILPSTRPGLGWNTQKPSAFGRVSEVRVRVDHEGRTVLV